jgi:hypothetical protein
VAHRERQRQGDEQPPELARAGKSWQELARAGKSWQELARAGNEQTVLEEALKPILDAIKQSPAGVTRAGLEATLSPISPRTSVSDCID